MRQDIINTRGNLQLCTGIRSECEIAVYASVNIFEDESWNCSNRCIKYVNRAAILHNMKILCREFATYVYNCYQITVKPFISGVKETQSNEGTTQSNPVAISVYATVCMYAAGVFPLVHLNETTNEMNVKTKRLALAYNLTGAGKLHEFQSRLDSIVSHGLIIQKPIKAGSL